MPLNLTFLNNKNKFINDMNNSEVIIIIERININSNIDHKNQKLNKPMNDTTINNNAIQYFYIKINN